MIFCSGNRNFLVWDLDERFWFHIDNRRNYSSSGRFGSIRSKREILWHIIYFTFKLNEIYRDKPTEPLFQKEFHYRSLHILIACWWFTCHFWGGGLVRFRHHLQGPFIVWYAFSNVALVVSDNQQFIFWYRTGCFNTLRILIACTSLFP